MMRSLYSAISGLKNHQIKMDVIGNNIANVNTTGFKRSRVTFATTLSQTLKGASSPSTTQGGTNPVQVGLGTMLGSIDQVMTQGSAQSTGKDTDLMLQGSGFFVLNNAGQEVYTRAGGFSQDKEGYLEDPATGAKVQGFTWGADDSVPPVWSGSGYGAIRFALGDVLPSEATTINDDGSGVTGAGTFTSGDPTTTPPTAATYTLPKSATHITIQGLVEDSYVAGNVPNPGHFMFDSSSGTVYLPANYPAPSTTPLNISYVDSSTVPSPHTLTSFSIDQNGIITGVYSNGTDSVTHKIAQIAVAKFANDSGLQNVGGSFYATTNNSGAPSIGAAGTDGRATILPDSLEMSNVDLSQEFTDMIVAQRGFQANSRVITVSDTLLQELIDLKRQ